MSAVVRATLADLRRRKLQTAIVALVVFLSSVTATLALTLLYESDAPFDHAFAHVLGAHLTVTFDSAQVSEAQAQATGHLAPISAAAGPWQVVPGSITTPIGRVQNIPIAGRADPGGPVDRLTLDSGRWVQRTGEVVLSRNVADQLQRSVGDWLTPAGDSPFPSLHIVGIAVSLSNDAAAWVEPSQIPATRNPSLPPPQYLMAYRLHQASTRANIRSAIVAISASVPDGAVQDTSNYLDAKLNADRTTAVMIPFLLAFGVFAMLASALIIANLVGGAVIAATRAIGIMKSVGFTPAQVVASFAGQMLIPAAVGCLLGLPVGVLLSQPFLTDTAHAFGLPRTFGVAPLPDLLGVGAILLVVVTTTILASLRAGRQSAAAAIAAGGAPAGQSGITPARLAARVRLPRAFTLGIGESVTRPIRSGMTIAAILIGVATVTFAIGLHQSLTLVASALTRAEQVQVQVYRSGGVSKTSTDTISDDQATQLIASQPGTARIVGIGHATLSVPGAGEAVPVFAYRGDSSWIGYVVIHGRWFHSPGEAVVPTAFFARTGTHVGDTLHASYYGEPVALTLVGEIFDQQGDDVLIRTSMASLPGRVLAWDYEVQLRPGTDPMAYAVALQGSHTGLDVRLNRQNGIDVAFLLINGVLAGLALVLALIAISGVFNTVVMNTREKARDIAILKSVGMTPRQVVTMVLASVAILGLVGAIVGIPAGMILHREIVIVMGQIATSTGIPDPFFKVFDPVALLWLGAAGVAIAMLGAMLPAQWAARSRINDVLQTE